VGNAAGERFKDEQVEGALELFTRHADIILLDV
jgi:hypothetical protein